ncbi:MAG: MBOAT family protein [Clostridiales bacterium]|nr:MBOAT family protein [Clostridiales bacterium]MDD2571690.1 MBOAT family protein [Eubacteriales bacterium]
MLFSSVTFLYYFLPAVLVVYFVVPGRWKNAVLLLASLLFYAWGEPRFSIIMVTTAMTGYLSGRIIEQLKGEKLRKAVLITGLILVLCPLLLFKYGDFFIRNIDQVFPGMLSPLGLVLPIGVSFYTFQILSYVIDVYRREVDVEKNPFYFLMYVSFFPQLIAGPIVRFQTIQKEIRNRKVTLELFASGITRFVTGLGKKILIANLLAEFGQQLSLAGTRSVLSLWAGALAFTFQIYFDFSGYSDMAIGLGRMFGFQFLENFDYPYLSQSITEFWRRWHMSLGSWFRDYVYIPLGGSRVSSWKMIRNLWVVWLLTGFWHGASWNFVVWGFFYFILLQMERIGLSKILDKAGSAVRIIYTFFFVNLGFVLFNADSLTEALSNIGGMFGGQALKLWDPLTLYYVKSYALVFLLAIIASTPYPKRLWERIRNRTSGFILDTVAALGVFMVLFLSTAQLVDGSFNPFLYFRF